VDVEDPTIKILPGDCDVIIDNNGTEEELTEKVTRLFDLVTNKGAIHPYWGIPQSTLVKS
jgi:hypothetical protein